MKGVWWVGLDVRVYAYVCFLSQAVWNLMLPGFNINSSMAGYFKQNK